MPVETPGGRAKRGPEACCDGVRQPGCNPLSAVSEILRVHHRPQAGPKTKGRLTPQVRISCDSFRPEGPPTGEDETPCGRLPPSEGGAAGRVSPSARQDQWGKRGSEATGAKDIR